MFGWGWLTITRGIFWRCNRFNQFWNIAFWRWTHDVTHENAASELNRSPTAVWMRDYVTNFTMIHIFYLHGSFVEAKRWDVLGVSVAISRNRKKSLGNVVVNNIESDSCHTSLHEYGSKTSILAGAKLMTLRFNTVRTVFEIRCTPENASVFV